jgi:drug/metabolite transporter (DMT)-like permease
MASASANQRGIFAMLGAGFCFGTNDAMTKLATHYLPVSQIVALRGLFAFALALLIILMRQELYAFARTRNPALILRALVEGCTGVVLIYSLSRMPLANVTAILMIQPFLLTMVGAAFLGEIVGWRRWLAIVAGFIGMLLVMKPATSGFNSITLVVLLATGLILARDLLTRKIPHDIPISMVVLGTSFVGSLVGLSGSFVEPWIAPSPMGLFICLLAAMFLVAAFYLMTLAFRGTDVSVISPFRYAMIVNAVFLGYVLFGDVPDFISVIGMAIIVTAGLYMLHREAVNRRKSRVVQPKEMV